MTDAEFTAWLKDGSAYRTILIDVGVNVGGAEIRRHLSSVAFVTGVNDSPAHTHYLPIIVGGIRLQERVDIDSKAAMTFGDIELNNTDGQYDGWLNDIWRNHTIEIKVGDSRWPVGAFKLVFSGIVEDIDSRNRDRLNLIVRDKLERLNVPMTETVIGGADLEIAEELKPLCFGEVFNIEPVLINQATHTYQIHNGSIERIVEVRDNGIPVLFTPDLDAGTFTLKANPVGTITCSAQGDNLGFYRNTPAGLIRHIVTTYGTPATRFIEADLDLDSFLYFDQFGGPGFVFVGDYLTDRINILDFITRLAASCRGVVAMRRNGQLRMFQLMLPAAGTAITIGDSDIVEHSLSIAERFPVQAAIRLGYNKNFTVQNEVAGGVLALHKTLLKQEWLQVKARDAFVKAQYGLNDCPEQIDTLLVKRSDAQSEAEERLKLWKARRHTFRMECFAQGLFYQLGQRVILKHNRFGLDAGREGMIVGLEPDWINARCTVDVLV